MHSFLSRLGVPPSIQQYFSPYYKVGFSGNLHFPFSDSEETYGPGLHHVPATNGLWIAGDQDSPIVSQVFIGHSAMELIAFLTIYHYSFKRLDQLLFIATGSGLSSSQLFLIRESCEDKSCAFIFGKDMLGHIADLKAAAGIRKMPLSVALVEAENLEIMYRNRQFYFSINNFSLAAFERVAGCRFKCRTYKSKIEQTFLAHLNASKSNV